MDNLGNKYESIRQSIRSNDNNEKNLVCANLFLRYVDIKAEIVFFLFCFVFLFYTNQL